MARSLLQGTRRAALVAAAWLACASAALAQEQGPVSTAATAAELELLALDPRQLSASQVEQVLSRFPAPALWTFKGSLFADMQSFGRFLAAMGYPSAQIHAHDITWRACTCVECAQLVATMASQHERDGMAPMLVGHSGGGVVVSRLLYGLAAARATDAQRSLPVRVPYAAVLATGTLMRSLPGFPGCAEDVARLTQVPDAAAEFTSLQIEGDLFTLGTPRYEPIGQAAVRNVLLPGTTSHVGAFRMDGLAQDTHARAWIGSYRPDQEAQQTAMPEAANILQAADIWYSIKKHWCTQAQRQVRERLGQAR